MSTTAATGAQRKYVVAIAGTVAVLVVAAVTFQILRPSPAFSDQPGKASVGETGSESAKSQKYIARVNSELLSYDELATECVNRYGREILDNLINRKIIEQACKKHGIEITADEVNAEILKIAKRFSLSVEQWLAMLQAERNVNPAQYKQDIIWPMLALRKLAGEEVTITEQELERAFIRNYGPRVQARVLVLDNSRHATQVWEQARQNPDQFEQLVYKHSVDPSSRPLGGVVPAIRRYAGQPNIEKAAFALKPGQISGVIQVDESQRQFVIIKCEGLTEQIVTDKKEVRAILEDELREEKVQESVAKVFERIKAEAREDNYLTGVSQKKAAAKPPGQVTPASATDPAGRTSQTPPARKTAPRTTPRTTN